MRKKTEAQRVDIYTRITDRIVEDLSKGVRPWVQPWCASNMEGRITRPLRHNGLPYSGMNVLLLWSEGIARGFSSPMWMSLATAIVRIFLPGGGTSVRTTPVRSGEPGRFVTTWFPIARTPPERASISRIRRASAIAGSASSASTGRSTDRTARHRDPAP